MTPFQHFLYGAPRVVDLMGEVGVVVFLLGGWTLAPRRNWEFDLEIERKGIMINQFGVQKNIRII